MKFKKWLMRLMWRFENSQRMTAVIFWTFTITGVFYNDYIYANFKAWGLIGIGGGQFTFGFIICFGMVLGLIFSVGFLFDRVLKLWREMVDIRVDRDPYQRGKFYEKERKQWEDFFVPMLEAINENDIIKGREIIERAKRWTERGFVIDEEEKGIS